MDRPSTSADTGRTNVKKKSLNEEFPIEVRSQMKEFQELMTHLKKSLQPLMENYADIEARIKDNPLESARVDLTTVYAINSLFWGECHPEKWTQTQNIQCADKNSPCHTVYLITKGENPKEHDVTREIARLKASMTRFKELQNRSDTLQQRTMVVDTAAASRLVRGALWTPGGENVERADDSDPEPTVHKKKKLRTH